MSEDQRFVELQEEEGLDIDAIFGSVPDTSANPPGSVAEPQPAQADETPAPAAESITAKSAPEKRSTDEEEPSLFSAFAEPKAEVPKDEKPEATQTQRSLFEKPPVFSYGSVREEIKDLSLTFEELRIQKADDFPELAEGKKVSWTVKYGDVTKAVAAPKDVTVAKMKEEIERSKTFLDALKKGKNKNPDCLVIPKVTAGSKGLAASYKGVYPSIEAARSSDKVICLIPASNGRVYEMRKTEMGEMIAPKRKIVEFSDVRAGFVPALPRIPRAMTEQLITFFRSLMSDSEEFEALAFVYWDRQEHRFVLHIPKQTASKAHIGFQVDDAFPEERYLHYADIHSHNSMSAEFSVVDDRDEQATRLYIVMGRLNRFYPEISARVCCGGVFLSVDPADVLESIDETFPTEWTEQVVCERAEPVINTASSETNRVWEELFL